MSNLSIIQPSINSTRHCRPWCPPPPSYSPCPGQRSPSCPVLHGWFFLGDLLLTWSFLLQGRTLFPTCPSASWDRNTLWTELHKRLKTLPSLVLLAWLLHLNCTYLFGKKQCIFLESLDWNIKSHFKFIIFPTNNFQGVNKNLLLECCLPEILKWLFIWNNYQANKCDKDHQTCVWTFFVDGRM